jgi:four helix bundle protein
MLWPAGMHETPRFKPPTYEAGQDIRDRAFEYACEVVAFCEHLSSGDSVSRLMVPQLLNCSLSFATMLEEARGAESDDDFISKCCIGLKECRESWTRIRVCERRKKGPLTAARQLVQEGNELIAIVATIIGHKRKSVAAKRAAAIAAKIAEREAKKATERRRASVTTNS